MSGSRFLAIGLIVSIHVLYSSSLLFAEDNTTIIISGTVSNNGGASIVVGNTGTNNYLEINSSGVLTNVFGVSIGATASASNNTVTVSGSGSGLYNDGMKLFVGYSGSGNTLTIANGGVVNSMDKMFGGVFIGWDTVANSNAVLVTGLGSVLQSSADVQVGRSGSYNTLTIANNGTVYDDNGVIGPSAGANNNAVTVTGTGSVWTNLHFLYLGSYGSDNSLTIADGGAVYNSVWSAIGYDSSVSNNTVTVTGPDSVWNSSGDLYVGYYGSDNRLTITNGGAVVIGGQASIGYSGGMGNQLMVDGGKLTVTNSAGTGSLNVRNGVLTFRGGTITANNLYATNGVNSVVAFNGGLLNVASATIANGSAFVVGNGANPATLNLQGGNSSFADGLVITNNAVLSGNGMIRGSATISGSLSPGNSIGTLVFSNNLTLVGALNIELDNLPGAVGTGDFVNVVGQWDITGGMLNFSALSTLTNSVYVFGQYGSLVVGFSATNNLPTGYSLNTGYNGNQMALQAVPEPSALTLVGGGLLFLAFRRKLFRKK